MFYYMQYLFSVFLYICFLFFSLCIYYCHKVDLLNKSELIHQPFSFVWITN